MKMHQFNDKDFNLQLIEISEIQLIGEDDTVDICVQQDHVFFVNNILTHNSSINQQLLLGDGISHSMMKLEIADFVISLSRKQEDKLSNTARFVIVKNRHGKDGMVYNGLVDLQLGDIQIFDTYTKESIEARNKMDNNDKLMKQKIKQRIAAINNKIQGGS